MGFHQPQSIILQQQQPLEEEVWFGSAGATQLCPGRPGKMCHTFLHLEWSWLAYLYISSFQQTWKILILKTSSWLFSYHSGLHWKAYFRGHSTSQSIVQFQLCWTKDQKSQEESDIDPTDSTEAAGYREDTVVQIPTGLPQPFVRLERDVVSNGCLHTAVNLLCRKRLYVCAGTTENLTIIQS